MEGLTPGRMVHYVVDGGDGMGEHRPAVVVSLAEDGPEGAANLAVFVDLDKDRLPIDTLWRPNVPFSETGEPATWHWIERAS